MCKGLLINTSKMHTVSFIVLLILGFGAAYVQAAPTPPATLESFEAVIEGIMETESELSNFTFTFFVTLSSIELSSDFDRACNFPGENELIQVKAVEGDEQGSLKTIFPSNDSLPASSNPQPLLDLLLIEVYGTVLGSPGQDCFVSVDFGGWYVNVLGSLPISPPPSMPNRPPEIEGDITAGRHGQFPDLTLFEVTASDPDGDALAFTWRIEHGETILTEFTEPLGLFTFDFTASEPGTYRVRVTVSDGKGGTDNASLRYVIAGRLDITVAIKMFQTNAISGVRDNIYPLENRPLVFAAQLIGEAPKDASFEWMLDGVEVAGMPASYGSTHVSQSLDAGQHKIEVRFMDDAGTVITDDAREFTVYEKDAFAECPIKSGSSVFSQTNPPRQTDKVRVIVGYIVASTGIAQHYSSESDQWKTLAEVGRGGIRVPVMNGDFIRTDSQDTVVEIEWHGGPERSWQSGLSVGCMDFSRQTSDPFDNAKAQIMEVATFFYDFFSDSIPGFLRYDSGSSDSEKAVDEGPDCSLATLERCYRPSMIRWNTPTVVVGVRGTDLLITGDKKIIRVFLREGIVDIDADREQLVLSSGEWVETSGEGLTPIQTFDTATWDRLLDESEGEMNPPEPSPPDGISLERALDTNQSGFLDDPEILEAIRIWISGKQVPKTGEIIDDLTIIDLIQLWITGQPIPE